MFLRGVVIKSFTLNLTLIFFLAFGAPVFSDVVVSDNDRDFVVANQYEVRHMGIAFAKSKGTLPEKLVESLEMTDSTDSILDLTRHYQNGEESIEVLFKSRLVVNLRVKEKTFQVISVGYSIY